MKKFIFSLVIMALVAVNTTAFAQAQDKPIWMKGKIELANTDAIVVLKKDVYCFFVHDMNNPENVGFFLTLDKDKSYYESIKDKLIVTKQGTVTGRKVAIMEGPYLSQIWQDNFLKDYRAFKKGEEKDAQDEIDKKNIAPEKEKKKDRKKRLAEIQVLKTSLKKMIVENESDIKDLQEILAKLFKGTIPVYLKMNSEFFLADAIVKQ